MNRQPRVVVVGAGHNGLVAACYLAKAGFAPLVLERRSVVGGIAVTEEIAPGFRCSSVAQTAGPLLPQIAKDLQLQKHGLVDIHPQARILALDPEGRSIRIFDNPEHTAAEVSRIFPEDAKKYPDFHASINRIGRAMAPLLSVTPPDIDQLAMKDYLNLGRVALNLRALDKKDTYRLLRWVPMPIADFAAEWFASKLLQAVIAARGVFGAAAAPRSPGTSIGLLLQAANDGSAIAPASFIKGGMGALSDAVAKAAVAAGAQIRTGSHVSRIRVAYGRVAAVVLATGEEIAAQAVVSSADPQHTLLGLVDPIELEPNFIRKVQNYRSRGTVAKVNLALSGLPNFSEIGSRMHVGPSLDYLEHAFDAAKYGGISPAPFMDITIPSLEDSSLAPKGAHVMSIHMQYAPYHLKDSNWKARGNELLDIVLNTLSIYAPNIRQLIVDRQILTPLDLEKIYGLTGGHIFHGEHSLDQLFAFRPILGWARYRTPIHGLYLCGAGAHPGGGITGAPGLNASREIIKDLKEN
jgi:phytoene dehydrogenase-like protein